MEMAEKVRREINILKMCTHPHIIRLLVHCLIFLFHTIANKPLKLFESHSVRRSQSLTHSLTHSFTFLYFRHLANETESLLVLTNTFAFYTQV